MHAQPMTVWGVGPRIIATAVLSLAVTGALTYWRPEWFTISVIPYEYLILLGIALLAIGVPMWLAAVQTVTRAFGKGLLITDGVYAWVRHPVYAAWIVFNLPGIALLCRSWLMLLVPLAALLTFKLSIRREEEYLAQQHGEAFAKYRAAVNELLPCPRLPRR